MKVCPACGTEYGDDAAFCSRDRSPLRPRTSEATPGLVGQLIGERYQVERRLGMGGMGEVYLARHLLMGRLSALKVIGAELSKDPDAVARFNREATNASRIAHPNVCAVYDFGLTPDGLVFLAMEYVEGPTLNDLLSDGPMPVARAAALVAECAAGLQAAHDLGIVHRDLKPDNIMVAAGTGRVKLVDFGIAKAAEDSTGQRVTKTGFVVGTPEYMSPEQLAGDPLDGRSDQYSLALVFYRLVTGRLPFEGTSLQETLVKRLTDPPKPLAQAHPAAHFPSGLQDVMDRALARQPAERFATVRDFAGAVTAIAGEDALPTRRLTGISGGRADLPPTRLTPARRSRA
ncbi:MAG: serine/threonine protein kinase, partial [Gemmatimonadales bacterium]|nr:serine/threonine protein kinase [Gemmatimonadales bacterium]